MLEIREMDLATKEHKEHEGIAGSLRWGISQDFGCDSPNCHDYVLAQVPVVGVQFRQEQWQRWPSLCAVITKGAQSPDAERLVRSVKCLNEGRDRGFGLEGKVTECGCRLSGRHVIGVPQRPEQEWEGGQCVRAKVLDCVQGKGSCESRFAAGKEEDAIDGRRPDARQCVHSGLLTKVAYAGGTRHLCELWNNGSGCRPKYVDRSGSGVCFGHPRIVTGNPDFEWADLLKHLGFLHDRPDPAALAVQPGRVVAEPLQKKGQAVGASLADRLNTQIVGPPGRRSVLSIGRQWQDPCAQGVAAEGRLWRGYAGCGREGGSRGEDQRKQDLQRAAWPETGA